MATYEASIKKALASQQDLVDHKEHCSADPRRLVTVGRALGHQVRIKRSDTQYALYTVSELRQESKDNIVRMGATGRQRLNTSAEFAATIDSQVPHPTFSDAEAETNSEFVERLQDDGAHTGLIAIAPHGGNIERDTDEQAERVARILADEGVSSWRCKGFATGGGAHDRWHITATDIHEASFPLLDLVMSRGFTYAVAFHGFDEPENPIDVLIGGAAPAALKAEIKQAIDGAITGTGMAARITTPDDAFGGDSPRNIVNRLTISGANGIQIEQSVQARSSRGREIADAIAAVYRSRLERLHPDPVGSGAHRNMFAHLSGPFTGGAVETRLAIDTAGRARVDWQARLPLLLIAPRQTLGATGLDVTVQIAQSSGEVVPPAVARFAPFTEAGAFVLAYRPGAASMVLDLATPFDVRLDAGPDSDPSTLGHRFELRVVEGNLARLLYLAGSEKMRLRRQANELYAMRRIADARADALDRLGAELSVPRFDARLSWDATRRVPTIVPQREADEPFRARLGIYRPFLRSSRRAVDDAVNGPGTGGNTGLPSQLGIAHRLTIAEPDSELLAAVRLVSSPDDAPRTAFLDYIRRAFLLQPGTDVPDSRLLPSDVRAEENALRARLAARFEFPAANAHIAPMLARALDRVGECRRALGVTRRWRVLRAQDDGGGSRYELGLGADVEVLPAAELDALVANSRAGRVAADTAPEIRTLLSQLQPRASSDDPRGSWLCAPCGLATIHPLDATTTYVSHLALNGLVITEDVSPGKTFLSARLNAPFDSGPDALLVLALADAEAARAAAGIAPWTLLLGTQERAAWQLAVAPPAGLVQSTTDARIHMETDTRAVDRAKAALKELPNELIVTLQLDAAFATQLIAHDQAAAASLLALIIAFQKAGFVSVLPLFTSDGRVLLAVAVTPLPGNATLLTARRESSFRWYLMPVDGQRGELERKIGSRNAWLPASGLSAVLVVAAAKRGSTDPRGRVEPLELRVSLPAGALLNLAQYEFLMNLLERTRPLGVIVDTQGIRSRVDADGDRAADRLPPSLSRTFRPYRQPRRIGAGLADAESLA
ncbi:MAG TPA: poly-gamma-glutamate hydrolase family protein [Vicinamibacterales bacterium]|nr:poly-gamma-glutamate hydrolase family protein [Vicinamibacterales bacterium]